MLILLTIIAVVCILILVSMVMICKHRSSVEGFNESPFVRTPNYYMLGPLSDDKLDTQKPLCGCIWNFPNVDDTYGLEVDQSLGPRQI